MVEEIQPKRTVTELVREKPNSEQPSNPWLSHLVAGAAVTSVIGLVILFLLLAVPVSMLVIGVRYRYWHDCPAEHRISLFLTVGGGVALGYFVFSIVLSIITMFLTYTRSFMALFFVVVLALITILIHVFLFIWVIIGSVWTFSITNKVQYTNPYHWKTYCRRTLYEFTFIYLIFIYVLWAIQCCVRCFFGIYRSRQKK